MENGNKRGQHWDATQPFRKGDIDSNFSGFQGLPIPASKHRWPKKSTSPHFNCIFKCPAWAPAKFASAEGKFFLITVSTAVTGREGLPSKTKNINDWGEKRLLSNPEKISLKFTFSTISQPNSNTKKLWNSSHVYEGFVQKSTAFTVSISAQLKLPISPDTYSGDNQHIHASSFRSYLKVFYGKTKESKRADESTQSDKQSPS